MWLHTNINLIYNDYYIGDWRFNIFNLLYLLKDVSNIDFFNYMFFYLT